MQHLQLNQRQLSLQRIIKSQEARINELEARLAEGGNLQNMRLEATVRDLTLRLQQKDKQVIKLKDQQYKIKTDLRQSGKNSMQSQFQELDSLLSENKSLHIKIRELQDQMKIETERVESDVTCMIRVNKGLQAQVNVYRANINSIESEIEKLQIFYHSALVELPKRIDTLQWVDNFIKFVNQYEQTLGKYPAEAGFDKFEKEILEFKREFEVSVKKVEDTHHQRQSELNKLKEQLTGLIKQCLKQSKEILNENETFWELIKKQKTTKISQLGKKHEEELAQVKQQSRKENEVLTVKTKTLQQEKKQLTMAFMELKSYYSNRQKSLTDELRLLKQTNEKLIEMGERREESFQNEVNKLSLEVSDISKKYQESIRIPFEEFNKRFSADLTKAIQQISNFPWKERYGQLLTRMDSRCRQTQTIIRKFGERQSSSHETMQRHLQHIDSLGKNLLKNIKFIVDTIDKYGQENNNLSVNFINEQLSCDLHTNRLELEELEQRKNYQINLLKLNNSKLQQINGKLQNLLERQNKEDNLHNDRKRNLPSALLSGKFDESSIQLQLLRDFKAKYQARFQIDLRRLRFAKYDRQIISVIADNLSKYEAAVHELRDYCQRIIVPAVLGQTQNTNQYLIDIKNSLKQTTDFIDQPIKRLSQIVKVQENIRVVPLTEVQNIICQRVDQGASLGTTLKEEIKAYREILTERQKSKIGIGKILSDVLQLLRNTVPSKDLAHKEQYQQNIQRKHKTEYTLEKRIKEIQQSRLKEKIDITTTIDKLTKTVRTVESSGSRSDYAMDSLAKSQNYLKQKVEYIIELLEHPLKGKNVNNQLNQLSKKAIMDLESKLKESICENEGILKQFKLLTNFNQVFKDKRDESSF